MDKFLAVTAGLAMFAGLVFWPALLGAAAVYLGWVAHVHGAEGAVLMGLTFALCLLMGLIAGGAK